MPWKPKTHGKRAPRRPDERVSASRRGYGARWRRLRLMFLRANALCVDCRKNGFTVEATEVHHILARSMGGGDEWENLEALCRPHHNQKTAAERGAGS